MRLDGRHAMITGGLGTIGQAIAAAFREAGAQVTLLDRPGLEPPEGYGWLPADLRDPKAAEGAVGTAGLFDILVNNAALILNKPHEAFTLEEYEEQIRVNSTAAFALARAVAPAMKLQRLHSPNLIRLQATERTHQNSRNEPPPLAMTGVRKWLRGPDPTES